MLFLINRREKNKSLHLQKLPIPFDWFPFVSWLVKSKYKSMIWSWYNAFVNINRNRAYGDEERLIVNRWYKKNVIINLV